MVQNVFILELFVINNDNNLKIWPRFKNDNINPKPTYSNMYLKEGD